MATENVIMDAVKKGGDRQELHERIRVHSMEAAKVVKEQGKPNDLIDRIVKDDFFGVDEESLKSLLKPENYVGRAPGQVKEYLDKVVNPLLEKYGDLLGITADINV